jgi:hypothetical protein
VEYDVGQVLYAVSHKAMKVIPLRVTERIVRQTLEGDIVTYVAQLPDGRELSDLSKLSGDIYISLDEVRTQMIVRITDVVDVIVDSSKESAVSAFGSAGIKSSGETHTDNDLDPQPQEQQGKSKITLPDGTVANITMPDGI